MKRSTQDKVKGSPMKQDSTKLRDMQKAYGVAPKDLTKAKSVSKSVKSVEGTSSPRQSLASTSTQKSKTSTNSSNKTRATRDTSNSRKSDASKASSKIIAASRANYAEKYGAVVTKSSLNASVNSPQKSKSEASSRNSVTNRRISVTTGATNNSSPYKQSNSKPPQKPSSIHTVSSGNSKLTSQNAPVFYESEATEDPAEENYEDDDFEEDYESDFEESMSSEGESEEAQPQIINEPPPQQINQSIHEVGGDDEVIVEEYDKSSSIREFEELEKMVARQDIVEDLQAYDKVSSLETSGFDSGGSGEPGSNFSPKSNDEDDDNDDSSEDSLLDNSHNIPSTTDTRRRSAFPTTVGFSIATSHQPLAFPVPKPRQTSSSNVGHSKPKSSTAITTATAPAKEKQSQKMKRTERGKIIQGMIKLDRVSVDIFHLAPYQYERFMAVFSGNDRLQASTQTDQDKSEESVQTEPIDQVAKWTQKPPTWSTTSSSCDIRIVRQEALGVGSDDVTEDLSPDQKIYKQFDFLKNWEQLSKFIIRASRKVLYVLETEERIKLPSNSGNKGSLETIKMSRGLSVLSKLSMHTLSGDGEFVACANGQPPDGQQLESKPTNGNKKHTSKNLVTVWSLKEPSMPLYFLRVWGHVSALKLHMIGRMVISGNKDGSLNVWNLDEPLCYHSHYQEQPIRTPSVNTSCMVPTHLLAIVGVEMFSDAKNSFSVASIDKEGTLITWACLRTHDTLGDSALSQHSSAWSTIHMSVRHQIQLNEIARGHLQITCFLAWDLDTTGFIFGTLNGYVAKGLVMEGSASIDKYQERSDSNPRITCMDVSKTLNILVMGCEDGRCRLFELSRKKLVLSLGGRQEPIRVKWSGRRASVVYVALKDSLLIWDLLTSDMNPWKTIHLKDIQDFVLYSPPHKEYLVVITGNDIIISTPADEVKPLNSRDNLRIQSYFSLLC